MITFTGPNGFKYKITEQKMYSDSTPMVKADIDLIANKADTLTVAGAGMMEFVTAMFLVDSIDALNGGIYRLNIPYFPGARQDRINPTGDVLNTAKSVAGMINDRDFAEVLILDPHSPATINHVNRSAEYPLKRVASKVWQGYTGVIAPDKGARGRARQFSDVMSRPLYLGEKVRDVSTGRLSGFDIDVPEGGHYLVVDDICDGGGTFIGLGEKIRECGAYADLYVTHGIFSKGVDELKKYYKNIYMTDSFNRVDGTYTIKVLDDMENY